MTKTIEAEGLDLTPPTAAPREAGQQEAGIQAMVDRQARNVAPAAPVAAQGQSGLVAMIERVALSPEADITKLEKLLDMKERIDAEDARRAYDAAMSVMQPELPIIEERGQIRVKGELRSKYAFWEDINEQVQPVLARHGFAITFRVQRTNGDVVVTGIVSHRAGHREETTLPLPVDTSGSKNPVQAIGSSTSYGKRYTAGLLLNLTSRGEDDDGNAAGNTNISEEQVAWLRVAIDDANADEKKFCRFMGVAELSEMLLRDYEKAKQALAEHKAAEAKRAKDEAAS